MSMGIRKRHDSACKAKVALEAINAIDATYATDAMDSIDAARNGRHRHFVGVVQIVVGQEQLPNPARASVLRDLHSVTQDDTIRCILQCYVVV